MGAEQSRGQRSVEEFQSTNQCFRSVVKNRRLSIDIVEMPGKIQQLTMADFQELADLESITLEDRSIESIEDGVFEKVPGLKKLKLERNALKTLTVKTFFGLANLEELYLGENELTTIENDWFKELKKLIKLDLHGRTLTTLKEQAFAGLDKLVYLDLSGNCIASCSARPFQHLASLETLVLNNNRLRVLERSMFSGMSSLTDLELKDNGIQSIEVSAFEGLTALSNLNLQRNKITNLDSGCFEGLESVAKLFLHNNEIVVITPRAFKGLSALSELSLCANKINRIEVDGFAGLGSLSEIHMDKNPLFEINRASFAALTGLSKMDMNEILIPSFPSFVFADLVNLLELDLSNSNIVEIQSKTFAELESLLKLDLSKNKITHIVAHDTFVGMTSLQKLNLSNNKIEKLNVESLASMSALREIYVDGNPLRCDARFYENLGDSLKRLYVAVSNPSSDEETRSFLTSFHVIVVPNQQLFKKMKSTAGNVSDINRLVTLLAPALNMRAKVREQLLEIEFRTLGDRKSDDEENEGGQATAQTSIEIKRGKLIALQDADFIKFPALSDFLTIIEADPNINHVLKDFNTAELLNMSSRLQKRTDSLEEEMGVSFSDDVTLKFRQVCALFIFNEQDALALSFLMEMLKAKDNEAFHKGLFESAILKFGDIPDNVRTRYLTVMNVLAKNCSSEEVISNLETSPSVRAMQPEEIRDICLSYIEGSKYPLIAALESFRFFLLLAANYSDPTFDTCAAQFMEKAHEVVVAMPNTQLAFLIMCQENDRGIKALEFAFKNKFSIFFGHPKVKKVFEEYATVPDFMKIEDTNRKVDSLKVKMIEKADHYFTTPMVKFAVRIISSIIFLLLFLIYLAQDDSKGLHDGFTGLEIVLYVFAGSILLEESSQLRDKGFDYFSSGWNTLDMTSIALFFIMIIVHLVGLFDPKSDPDADDTIAGIVDTTFNIAAGANILTLALRFLNIFRWHRKFGPMLRIVLEMVSDILVFVAFLLVILVGFSFAFFFVLRRFDLDGYTSVGVTISTMFFAFIGDFDSDVFYCTKYDYTSDDYCDSDWAVEHAKYQNDGLFGFIYALFVLYILSSLVTLLNLLIAMMSTTYDRVKETSEYEYMFLRCDLIHETHQEKAILPPPFTILVYFCHFMFYLLTPCMNMCCAHHEKRMKEQLEGTKAGSELAMLEERRETLDSGDDLKEEASNNEGWYCSVCYTYNFDDEARKVWRKYLKHACKGYNRNYAEMLPQDIVICRTCCQLKNDMTKSEMIKQRISILLWKMFVFPIRSVLFLPQLVISLIGRYVFTTRMSKLIYLVWKTNLRLHRIWFLLLVLSILQTHRKSSLQVLETC